MKLQADQFMIILIGIRNNPNKQEVANMFKKQFATEFAFK